MGADGAPSWPPFEGFQQSVCRLEVLALRYARDELKVRIVRTHHNSRNLPMIAIDRKFGYVQMSEAISMEKSL